MATKAQLEAIVNKRKAVIKRLNEMDEIGLDLLAGMWDERTLDQMILALGIGSVVLNEDH